MEFLRTEHIEIENEEPAEVEVYALKGNEQGAPENDPFLTQDLTGLPQKFKKRADRLEKAAGKAAKPLIDKTGAASKKQSPESITAYDVLQVVSPPYDLDMLAKLYEMNGAHNAAVTMKAINIVGLGYEWVENDRVKYDLSKIQKTGQQKFESALDKFEQEKLDLNEKIDLLNDDEDFNEIMVKVWTDVESLGNGYLEVSRNNSNQIAYLGHIPGQTIRCRAERDGYIQMVSNKYVFFANFGNAIADDPVEDPLGKDPRPNEVIHFSKYSPNSTYYGVPDIIAALPAALGDKFAREYNLDYFENKAVPRYAFILKGARLSAQAEQTLVNYFRNELKGKHHGTLYIPIPAGFGQQVEAEFKQIEVGIQEGSFTKYIQENRQDVLMVHRVPPGKVGIYANSNLAVSRDADKTFKEQVCRPEQKRVEKKLNKVMKEFTDHFKIKFVEADIIDADIRSRIHDRYLRTQVMVPNDVLTELGKPTRKDGNEPLPYEKGMNAGGPGQTSSDGAKPTRSTPKDQTGTRATRGESQDKGRPAAKS